MSRDGGSPEVTHVQQIAQTDGSVNVANTFPEPLRGPVLRRVQFSTIGRMDELGKFCAFCLSDKLLMYSQ